MTEEFNNVVIIEDDAIVIEDVIEHVPVKHDYEMQ
jgi:hypothetical protein